MFAGLMLLDGCKSDDPLPPAILPDNPCSGASCFTPSPSAAVAVVRDLDDGGPCGNPALRFSIPPGADAFSSILECGGNQVRCGGADYRVSSDTPGVSVACAVTGTGPFHVDARVSRGSAFFRITGVVDVVGGTDSGGAPDASSGWNLRGALTVSASSGADGGATGPLTCGFGKVSFVLPGSIWASFDCASETDPLACSPKGVFVFEHCDEESDGGTGP